MREGDLEPAFWYVAIALHNAKPRQLLMLEYY